MYKGQSGQNPFPYYPHQHQLHTPQQHHQEEQKHPSSHVHAAAAATAPPTVAAATHDQPSQPAASYHSATTATASSSEAHDRLAHLHRRRHFVAKNQSSCDLWSAFHWDQLPCNCGLFFFVLFVLFFFSFRSPNVCVRRPTLGVHNEPDFP